MRCAHLRSSRVTPCSSGSKSAGEIVPASLTSVNKRALSSRASSRLALARSHELRYTVPRLPTGISRDCPPGSFLRSHEHAEVLVAAEEGGHARDGRAGGPVWAPRLRAQPDEPALRRHDA